MTDSLIYPTGRFAPVDGPLSSQSRAPLIEQIRGLPERARAAVDGLDDAALDTPYREEGWTPRQIVHHLADSHMNAFIRVKLALTEDHPTIKPYDQAAWARHADTTELPPSLSLGILDGVHRRWVTLLESFRNEEWARTVEHPEIGSVSLDFFLQMYAWHGHHHTTQVEQFRKRRAW